MKIFILIVFFIFLMSLESTAQQIKRSVDQQWRQNISELQNSVDRLSIRNHELMREHQKLKEALEHRKKSIQEMISSLQGLESTKEVVEKKLAEKKSTTVVMEAEIRQLEEKKKNLDQGIQLLSTKIDQQKEQEQRLKKDASQIIHEARYIQQKYSSRQDDEQQLLIEMQAQKLTLVKFLENLKHHQEFLEDQLSDLEKNIQGLSRIAESFDKEVASLKKELSEIRAENALLDEKKEIDEKESRALADEHQGKHKALKDDIIELQKQKDEILQELDQSKEQLRGLRRTKTRDTTTDIQKKLRDVQSENKSLKEQLSYLKKTLIDITRKKEAIQKNLLKE